MVVAAYKFDVRRSRREGGRGEREERQKTSSSGETRADEMRRRGRGSRAERERERAFHHPPCIHQTKNRGGIAPSCSVIFPPPTSHFPHMTTTVIDKPTIRSSA